MDDIGPVDYAVVAFPGNRFTGEIAPALADLVSRNVIRIIDLTFVGKDDDGTVVTQELTDIDPAVRAGFESAGVDVGGLFNDDDLQAVAEEIPPGSSAALIVWENIWARGISDAVRGSGGELIDFGRIPHDVVQAAREWALAQANEEG